MLAPHNPSLQVYPRANPTYFPSFEICALTIYVYGNSIKPTLFLLDVSQNINLPSELPVNRNYSEPFTGYSCKAVTLWGNAIIYPGLSKGSPLRIELLN